MPRLFTALEVPAELAEELASLRGGLSGARWIEAEDYHLTLRFVGDIDEATANDLDAELSRIRRGPVTVTLEGLGAFGGDKPRAIVARVQASSALAELQAEQERAVRRVGLPAEPRKFTPHVTVARLRGTSPLAVADYLGTRGFLTRRFTAERVVLFSSRDSVGGGPYMVEAAYPLDGTAGARRRA
ncbi:MAG: RNA 2',3'-cyclic phosphodiesterase [Actinomycetospora chiangmaiensis]|nr:RNA 2',3'-cyclic phosphodiesterase [Actinomycetospora chiangmaiensis]